jgi:iron complex outermembrane receptor protein
MPSPARRAAALVPLALLAPQALAQSAAPGAVVTLEAIAVEGEAPRAADVAADRLAAKPGGASVIRGETLEGRPVVTLSDALNAAPGVVVQDFFGGFDQPRVQIRGSGLQQNPVERGVLFLQDGLPLNRADGSYVVGLADPRQAGFIEVSRGHVANRLGATVAGGALNFVSRTGSEAPGVAGRIEGGSFGDVNGGLRAGFARDGLDGLVGLEAGTRDGFRDYNSSERIGLNGNLGVRLTDAVTARLFAGVTDLSFDVAGPLPRALLDSAPERVYGGPTFVPGVPPRVIGPGPNVIRDRPARESTQGRLGARVSGEFGAHVLDAAFGYAHADDSFRFPVSTGVRETEGGDGTLVARYAYAPDADAPLPLVELTGYAALGAADRDWFVNDRGAAGARFGANRLEAATLSAYAGVNLPLGAGWTLSPGVGLAHATRDNDDRFAGTRTTIAFNPANPAQRLPDGAAAAQDTGYGRDYTGFTPALALSWRPVPDQLLFGAVSRSFEPPTHDDLLSAVGGTPNSSAGRPNPASPAPVARAFATPDLDAQTGTTVEVGWRGGFGAVAADAVVYQSWIEDELLSLRDETGAPLGAVNADKTTHFGVELGLTAALADGLTGRVAYTYQDFRFDDDPLRGDNRLAGAPPHVVNLGLDWAATDALTLGARVHWRPDTTPVDNFDTVRTQPFATLDLGARYALTDTVEAYAEARNVFDTTYAASTLVVDQARADQAVFLPGEGRAFLVGLALRF